MKGGVSSGCRKWIGLLNQLGVYSHFKTYLRIRLNSLRLKIKAPEINRGGFLNFVFMCLMDRKLLFESTVSRLKIILVLFPKFI